MNHYKICSSASFPSHWTVQEVVQRRQQQQQTPILTPQPTPTPTSTRPSPSPARPPVPVHTLHLLRSLDLEEVFPSRFSLVQCFQTSRKNICVTIDRSLADTAAAAPRGCSSSSSPTSASAAASADAAASEGRAGAGQGEGG